MKQKNLVVSVPRLEPHRPPISVAIIAHAIELAGYNVDAIDLNIEFFHFLNNKKKYFEFDEIWDNIRDIKLSEFKLIVKFIKSRERYLKDIDCLMISVFGSSAYTFTHILCKYVRKHYPKIKIVLGGAGVLTSSVINKNNNFGEKMKNQGLVNDFIAGEGELAIVEYLNQNFNYPGISNDSPAQINDLNSLPFPNYKYFDLSLYDWPDGKTKEVFINGSRGCVRKCTYCDVARYWPKFRFRSGQNIADEMIFHYEMTGITKFYFTDSLINGSMKSFRDMCDKLANYNQTHNAGFSWGGQLIWRPKRLDPPENFEMMAAAGADTFYVGVETGSDKIRWEMDKKFTNDDIDYALEQFKKNNLKVMFLMLLGYLSETKEDHQETLLMFPRWQKYVASGTITGIDLGVTLTFFKNTPLENMIESHGVSFLTNESTITGQYLDNTNLWVSSLNAELTVEERIRRRLETHTQAIKYNWPIWRGPQRLEAVKLLAEKYKKIKEQSTNEKI